MGGDASNFYTLHDFEELWNAGSSEEMAAIVDEIEEKRMIDILTAKGYYISKEKELASDTDQSTDTSTYVNSINIYKDTIKKPESQAERYTLDQIHQLFDYRAMVNDNPYEKQEIDSVMGILHNAMNTTKPTIRIFSEDRPAMAVIGKLMKLDKDSIMYAIKKFSEQTERITNPTAYMLTILYTAPEQYNLDIQNQVSHNMADWKTRG